jgi:hypothetical protein
VLACSCESDDDNSEELSSTGRNVCDDMVFRRGSRDRDTVGAGSSDGGGLVVAGPRQVRLGESAIEGPTDDAVGRER